MYKSEACSAVWEIFRAGQLYEEAVRNKNRCNRGSKKYKQYEAESIKYRKIAMDTWDKMQWNFQPRPGSFTSTDFAANRQ